MAKEPENNAEELEDLETTESIETEAEEEQVEATSVEVTEPSSDDKIAELEKRYMNLFAEYENFRKRTAKEKEQLYADAIADVSASWLQVVDNIERAQASAEGINETNFEQIAAGIDGIAKGAKDIIAKLDIREIEASRGTAFDPNYHSAVMHIEDEELGEQEIAQVFQKGYIYKERVIRPAMVQVAN